MVGGPTRSPRSCFVSRMQAAQVSGALALAPTDHYFCIQGPGSFMSHPSCVRSLSPPVGGEIPSRISEKVSSTLEKRLPTLAYIVHPFPRVSNRRFIYLIFYLFFYIYLISRIIVDRRILYLRDIFYFDCSVFSFVWGLGPFSSRTRQNRTSS